MDDIVCEHPAWPSYFDVDVLVYDDDWSVVDNHVYLGLEKPGPPIVVLIDSITRLPDNLVFLRGQYITDDEAEPQETYYGIASREQYARKCQRPKPDEQ